MYMNVYSLPIQGSILKLHVVHVTCKNEQLGNNIIRKATPSTFECFEEFVFLHVAKYVLYKHTAFIYKGIVLGCMMS